ncbi:9893_t:CDS:2, partial [Dentiscutata heterogama]
MTQPIIKPVENSEKTLKEFSEEVENRLKGRNIKFFEYLSYNDIKLIGHGASSTVYSANFQGKTYALKKLKCNLYLADKEAKTLIKEIKHLDKLGKENHPNIVKFYGISRDPQSESIMLVLQFANNDNMRKYLSKKQQEGLYRISWAELIRIAIDITSGLMHLHDNDIIHRDLHSKNILINDGNALIADFGLSKQLNDTASSCLDLKGMIAYVDPQCLRTSKPPDDKKSDIYSLGVLFWELTSGIPPFGKIPQVSIILIKILSHERENVIDNTPSDYSDLYKKCWSSYPDQRPTLCEILDQLKMLSDKTSVEITNYIKKQAIKLFLAKECPCTYTFDHLDKSTQLSEIRRRLSLEKELLLGRQNINFFDKFGEKIAYNKENQYTLGDITFMDGTDLAFYIETDQSKLSFPITARMLMLDKGLLQNNDGTIAIADKQAFYIESPHIIDFNVHNEFESINNDGVIYQKGSIHLPKKYLRASDEYTEAIKDALSGNKNDEQKIDALNKISEIYGLFG